MAKNHLEELVAQLWRLKGYVVLENMTFFLSSGENRQVGGHSDADVIALKDGEVVHIECQTNWVPDRSKRNSQHQKLLNRFQAAEQIFPQIYSAIDSILSQSSPRHTRKIVVAGSPQNPRPDGPWAALQQFCQEHDITLIETGQVLREIVQVLRSRYPHPSERIGKEESFVVRTLIELIRRGMINLEEVKNEA